MWKRIIPQIGRAINRVTIRRNHFAKNFDPRKQKFSKSLTFPPAHSRLRLSTCAIGGVNATFICLI